MNKWTLLLLASTFIVRADAQAQKTTPRAGIEALNPAYVEPAGFKPLSLSGSTVTMDFKRAVIGDQGLPRQVIVFDENILTSPMRFDSSIRFPEAKPTLRKEGNSVMTSWTSTAGNLQLKTECKIEHDFMFVYTVTLVPSQKVSLDKFVLEIPLKLPDDKLLSAEIEPPKRLEAGIEAQRRRKQFVIKDKNILSLPFCPNIWLGNTLYGVGVNFESAAGIHYRKADRIISFDPEKSILSIRFIGRKTELTKPITYRFYLSFSPLRRLPANYRTWKIRTRYNNCDPTDGNQMIYWQFWRASAKEVHNNNWILNPDIVRKISGFDAGKSRMHYFIPSHATHSILFEHEGKSYLLEDPKLREIAERAPYIPNWTTNPKLVIPPGAKRFTDAHALHKELGVHLAGKSVTTLVPMSDDYADHLIAGSEKLIRLGAGGVYSDGNSPKQNYRRNLRDGEGFERPFFDTDGYRKLYKRLRHVVRSNDPTQNMIVHNSGLMYPPTLSFFDMVLFGETDFYWYQDPEKRDASKNGDFYYAHIWGDPDSLKFHYPRTWGMPQVLLPELRGRNRQVFPNPRRGTRTMLAYTIQFDMHYWPLWSDAAEIQRFDNIRHHFGMGDTPQEIVEFTPYWENKTFTSGDPAVRIGYYEKIRQHDPDYAQEPVKRYLLMVSNFQFSDTSFQLKMPAKLEKATVTIRPSGKKLPIEKGMVKLELAPYDFVVLEVTGLME